MRVDFDLIVIGGGAAGFYGATQAAAMHTGLKVLILEKTNKLLSKVRVSGGGRCNVTHNCFDPVKLSRHYPRGERALRTVFKEYGPTDTIGWFAEKGVQVKTEADGRIFPVTDDAETIIDCFLKEARRLDIKIETGVEVVALRGDGDGIEVETATSKTYRCKRILIAIGGSPKNEAYAFIRKLGHKIKPPIPSLFTFNDSAKLFTELMGISVPNAEVRIAGTKFSESGPLLITHWGLSGPAIIKLSAWAAEDLFAMHYTFTIMVSWIGPAREEDMRMFLQTQKIQRGKQRIHAHPLFELPQRLWTRFCVLAEIPDEKVWSEISHRQLNKLLEFLIKCTFNIKGKTTFKEEFVTCGGVDIAEVDLTTLESKLVKGVFFAGEVLNVDGETGGFNFQAAWSTAFVAVRSMFS